jgi:hypothetical protein
LHSGRANRQGRFRIQVSNNAKKKKKGPVSIGHVNIV